MAVSRSKAYEVLGLEEGASYDQIRSAYKRLALLWHPDKHGNSAEATKKFQEISSAYKRLTTEDEEDLIDISFEEMFDLFTHLVFGGRGYIPGNYYFDESSDSDDHCCDYHHRQKKNGFRHTSSPSTRTSIKKEKARINKPSFEEARTNGDALIREEEREKRQKEKKRERKRKRKQRKREEKETQAKAFTSSQQQSDSEESDESDSEEDEEEELNKKNHSKVSSNKQNGFQQLSNNTKHTMPNKKSNSSDKKHNSSDKKQSSSLKNASGTSNKKNSSDHMTHNGSSGGTSNNKSSKNNRNLERKKEKEGSSGEDEATQGLDLNSAFFAGTVNSVNKKLQSQKKNKKGGGVKPEEVEAVESTENKIQKSRKLAIRGNECANKGDYRGAIELFSSAISLDPSDHRFFGNRSYCFDQSNQYDKALKDAERAISLAKEWPKGYFRKGRALAGLKSFNDAEKAYEQVLKLDPGCEEAMQELKRVRVLQLMDMGFTRVQSEIAVIKCGNVQAAAEALLSGALDENSLQDLDEEVYISEEEDVLTETIQKAKTDVRNPEKLRSIWIGNLSQDATEKQIRDLFGRYGEIESMRRLSEKFCAFINYRDAAMASEAMRNLQGYQFFDSQLLIKFPDHPITDGHLQTIYLKKNKPSGDAPLQPPQPQRQKTPLSQSPMNSNKQNLSSYSQGGKPGGPVNGNECYFWRTTGCWYGERCRYQHLPASKGADLQPWHRGASAE